VRLTSGADVAGILGKGRALRDRGKLGSSGMIAALALLAALLDLRRSPVQDAPAAPETSAKHWTQAELEKVAAGIQSDVEELRGLKFKRPVKVKVTDQKGFLEYARKRQEKIETPERQARDEAIAKLLGLIPPGMDLRATLEKLLEGQVGGFYEPGADTFYLMDSFGGDLARIILAHELTHALDDQYFDLDANLKKVAQDTDSEFAYSAVVEGSGTSAMNQWTVGHMDSLDRQALLGASDVGTKGLEDAPPFLWKPLIAAYLRGEGFLVHAAGMNIAMKAPAAEDVRLAFEHPPRSSEQILHPEKYWDEAKRDEPRSVRLDLSKIPADWKPLGEDTLGELYLALVTTPVEKRKPFDAKNPLAVLSIDYTNKAAEGWGGDRAVLLAKGDARVLWLVTAWDTPKDAGEFLDAASAILEQPATGSSIHRRVEREGDSDVVVVAAFSGVAETEIPKPAWSVAPKPEEKR